MALVAPFFNLFAIYDNTSTYIITFGLKFIHGIHYSYYTSNAYFMIFMILGDNPFVMPGVNYIYELVGYNKIHLCYNSST